MLILVQHFLILVLEINQVYMTLCLYKELSIVLYALKNLDIMDRHDHPYSLID